MSKTPYNFLLLFCSFWDCHCVSKCTCLSVYRTSFEFWKCSVLYGCRY